MNVIRKLPEREKSPDTLCPSSKIGSKFVNPWPSHKYRSGKFINNAVKSIMAMAYSLVGNEKNKQLKVKVNLESINKYYEDPNNDIQITWLGHAAFLIQVNGFTGLLDPLLNKRASPIKFIGPYRCKQRGFKTFADLPAIDFIIISHNHYDHLDRPTLKEVLREKKNKNVKIFCPKGNKRWFIRKAKVPTNQVFECDWWDDFEFARVPEDTDINNEEALNKAIDASEQKIVISSVPSQHNSGRSLFDQMRSLWCGYVIKSPYNKFYFAGDTGYRATPNKFDPKNLDKYPYCPAFKQIGNVHGPFDLACIPVGPVYPASLISSDHANANDAVNIHIDCKSKHSVAMHWGTVEYLGLDSIKYGPAELKEELRKKNIPLEEFHDVYIGEMVKVTKDNQTITESSKKQSQEQSN